jgi:hypothetical protein
MAFSQSGHLTKRASHEATRTGFLPGRLSFGLLPTRRIGSGKIVISDSRSRSAANWLSRKIIPPMKAQIKKKHTPSAVGIRKNGMEVLAVASRPTP